MIPNKAALCLIIAALGTFSHAIAAEQRAAGTTYYRCTYENEFLIPNRFEQPPSYRDLTKRKSVAERWPLDAPRKPETVQARATVEQDGSISSLQISWLQFGLIGWPYTARTDLDGAYLKLRFDGRERYRSPYSDEGRFAKFDLDRLMVSIVIPRRKKYSRPKAIYLRRGDYSGFGGLAGIPNTRREASLETSWRELEAFAGGERFLQYTLSEIRVGNGNTALSPVKQGLIDIDAAEVAIAEFRLAEKRLLELAKNRDNSCEKRIQEEAPDTPVL